MLDKSGQPGNNLAEHAMGFLSQTVKKIVFWTYPRTSWQWDVLCVLILVFIFLTPKSWFENTEIPGVIMAQRTMFLAAEVIGNQSERANTDRKARAVAESRRHTSMRCASVAITRED